MKLVSAVLVALLLLLRPVQAQDPSSVSDAPYIYYYSDVLNGLVIERADGTDSRLLAFPLMETPSRYLTGGEWSPSGEWLTLRELHPWDYGISYGRGYAVRVDGRTMEMLDSFECIHAMMWYPPQDLLFVMGQLSRPCGDPLITGVVTYWIIDASTETLLVSASLEETQEVGPRLHWFDDVVRFSATEWSQGRFYRVSMHFDGRVEIETYSRVEWEAGLTRVEGGIVDRRATGLSEDREPSYFITACGVFLQDEREAQIDFTPPSNSDGSGRAGAVLWHRDPNWALFGYAASLHSPPCDFQRVSVYQPLSRQYREISACGIDTACVGWLPENVSLDALPPGRMTSVLPAPLYYMQGNRIEQPTHALVCKAPAYISYEVVNLATGIVDYEMPLTERCAVREDRFGEPTTYHQPYTPDVVFAITPERRYFAMNPGAPNVGYTHLFDAQTGEALVTLNFRAYRLSFSEDGTILYTGGHFRDAAWRIDDLLQHVE